MQLGLRDRKYFEIFRRKKMFLTNIFPYIKIMFVFGNASLQNRYRTRLVFSRFFHIRRNLGNDKEISCGSLTEEIDYSSLISSES